MKNDIGLILSIKKFEEKKILLKILSQKYGIINGIARKKSLKDITLNIGNLIHFNWFGRENNLGILSCELKKSYATLFLIDKMHSEMMIILFNLLNSLFHNNMMINHNFIDTIIFYMDKIININFSQIDHIEYFFELENIILNYSGHFDNNIFAFDNNIAERIKNNEYKLTFLYNNILNIKIPDYITKYRNNLLNILISCS